MAKPEQDLQIKVCDYLRNEYPDIIFFSESSGLRVSPGLAKLLKKLRPAMKPPDMFIAYPNEKFHGFFIELKIEGTTIFKKDGELVADPHIRAQFQTLLTLHKLGYAAIFGVGYEHIVSRIDGYLSNVKKIAPRFEFHENDTEIEPETDEKQ